MYIDEFVQGLHLLCNSGAADPINIGSAEMVTINQLVDVAEEIAGVKLKRCYNLDAPRGVRVRSSDNTHIKQLLGLEPSTPLTEGMEEAYAWIYHEMVRS